MHSGILVTRSLCLFLALTLSAFGGNLDQVDIAVRVKDYARAVQLLKPLAEKGNAEAQYRLAGFYRMGTSVEKSHEAAVLWLKRAADQGYAKAQYNLGMMYDNGWGVNLDHIMAEQWFKLAAAQGYDMAVAKLREIANAAKPTAQEMLDVVRRGETNQVPAMIVRGADINAADGYGRTP